VKRLYATLVLIAAAIAGVGLYALKYEVIDLEQQLDQLHRAIAANREASHLLQAEWSYLNNPDRLRRLTERFLSMEQMEPTRIGLVDGLPEAGSNIIPVGVLPRPPARPPELAPPIVVPPPTEIMLASAGGTSADEEVFAEDQIGALIATMVDENSAALAPVISLSADPVR
jgi:hypothetical protein